LAAQKLPENHHDDNRDDPVVEQLLHGRLHVDNVSAEVCACVVKTLGQIRVRHHPGLINGVLSLFGENDLIRVDLDLVDFLLGGQVHEDIVGNFFDPRVL